MKVCFFMCSVSFMRCGCLNTLWVLSSKWNYEPASSSSSGYQGNLHCICRANALCVWMEHLWVPVHWGSCFGEPGKPECTLIYFTDAHTHCERVCFVPYAVVRRSTHLLRANNPQPYCNSRVYVCFLSRAISGQHIDINNMHRMNLSFRDAVSL